MTIKVTKRAYMVAMARLYALRAVAMATVAWLLGAPLAACFGALAIGLLSAGVLLLPADDE